MYPVLFELGPVKIYAFGTFIVLAFLTASWFARRRAMRVLEIDGELAFNVCFALLFLGLLGARFLYVAIHYETFVAKPMSFLKVWEGGLAFLGGLFACLAALAWYLPRHRELKGFAFADTLALGACLAIFVGRFASLLSGENWGDPAPGLAWGVTFPIGQQYSQVPSDHRGIVLHPTQLYHALHGLLLFGLLLLAARRTSRPGRVTGLFLMGYALGRALIEIWRADDVARGMVIPDALSLPQLLCIPVFFVGLAIFLSRRGDEADA